MSTLRFRQFIVVNLSLWTLLLLLGVEGAALFAQPGEATPVNFKIAFIGDQGLGAEAEAVLKLIKAEGTQAVLHQGDFDYNDNPAAWEAQIDKILGANFPYFASVGNHDKAEWGGVGGYQHRLQNRMKRLGLKWEGDLGVKSAFRYKGIFIVLVAPDVYGFRHAAYIRERLAQDHSIWSICSWHKNMNAMQMGGKSDDTGWEVYEEARLGGAIIATGHEHSYCRSYLMNDIENQNVVSRSDTLTLTKGESFVFVSGLGGKSVRDQERTGKWWASIYTSNQGARPGALFGTFNFEGQRNVAKFYFKNIEGKVVDRFVVISNVESMLSASKDFRAGRP